LAAILMVGCNRGPQSPVEPPGGADPRSAAPKQGPAEKPQDDRVVLTDRAAKQLRKLLTDNREAKYLRVSVSDDRLKLDLDTQMDPKEDLLGESRGVPVVVDRKSAAILPVGSVVDYIDEDGTRGFKPASPGADEAKTDTSVSLVDARRGFKTKLRSQKQKPDKTPVPDPPGDVFQVVRYDAPPGKLAAYLTPD